MKTYLKFLSRNKLYTAIEFIGLSVALAFVIISFCYVVQQYAVTRENPDRERIYAVGESESFLNCYGMKEVIDGKLPEVETVSHFHLMQDQLINVGEQNFVGNMLVCDVDFFSIFPVVFKEGSPEMLSERNAAFISEKLAKKLNEASAERPLIIQDDTLHIVGVIADKGSSLLPEFDVMLSFEYGQSRSIKNNRENPFNHWANLGTFIKVRSDVDQEELASKLQALCDVQFENSPIWDGLMMVRFDELYYASVYTSLNKGDRSMLRTMIIIGLLLLISALLNYINLNVALVGKRAKEMASRRLLGAQKSDIVWKFLGEAFVFTLFSFVVGLAIAHAIVPTVNRLLQSDVAITISFALPYLVAYLLMVIVVSLLAGMTGLPYGENNFDSIVMWQKHCIGMPVCGVLADFSMQDALHVTDEDYVIVFGNGGWNPDSHLLIDVVGDHREAKHAIDAVYKKHCEKVFGAYLEPDYNDFVENVIAKQYDKQRRQMRLIELIMAISVILSLLGLVAMSTHFASEREKTIAIRKVFGGTMQSEIRRNLKEYIIMILIANAIAIPVAVWLCKRYLEDFAYRIDLHPWIFVVTVALSFVIAIGSVLWQIVSVARVNPVTALKKE